MNAGCALLRMAGPSEGVSLLKRRCRLSGFEQIASAGRCSRWCADEEAEVGKDLHDHGLLKDGGKDGQVATAMGTV